jgi:hypothetical protein
LADHNDPVPLTGHVGHDMEHVGLIAHYFFEQLRYFGSIPGFADKGVVYDNHEFLFIDLH